MLRPGTRTITPNVSKESSTVTGTYYTQNVYITNGNRHYNRVAGDTPFVMIGSELSYNAG